MKKNVSKYAQAFINVFGTKTTHQEVIAFRYAANVLKRYRVILNAANEMRESQNKIINILLNVINHEGYEKLIKLLIKRKEIQLLPEILLSIEMLYKKIHNTEQFYITSYPQLSVQEQRDIQLFLAHFTGKDIMYEYTVDPKLISGIRAQSNEHIWENSVQQKLRHIRQILIR